MGYLYNKNEKGKAETEYESYCEKKPKTGVYQNDALENAL